MLFFGGFAEPANSMTPVSGTLAPPGSLMIVAPASYVPGVPILVRVDLRDGAGNVDRAAWNRTVNLTASGAVTLTPSTMTITNGIGSALVTIGGGSGGTVNYFTYGTGGTGSADSVSGTPGSTWRVKHDLTTATIGAVPANWKDEGFNDTSWITRPTQTGYGETDENQQFPLVDYDAGHNRHPARTELSFSKYVHDRRRLATRERNRPGHV